MRSRRHHAPAASGARDLLGVSVHWRVGEGKVVYILGSAVSMLACGPACVCARVSMCPTAPGVCRDVSMYVYVSHAM